jgi:hypothetical protein
MKLIMITTLAGPELTADAGTPVDVSEELGTKLKAGKFARDPKPGELKGGMSDLAFMAAITGKPVETDAERAARDVAERGLRQDGPTVAEYVKAGYSAKTYPPAGYAGKSTAEEVAEAVKAEEAAAIAKAKSPESVKAALDQLDPANDEDWTAAGLPAMGRIEALIGTKEITRAEVSAMFPDFKRPEANAGGGNAGGSAGDQGGGNSNAGGRSGPRTNNR